MNAVLSLKSSRPETAVNGREQEFAAGKVNDKMTLSKGVSSEPDRFDISRPEIKHVAFGGGVHFCLGAALGRLEGRMALGALIQRFPNLRLTGDAVIWRPSPVFRGLEALRVRGD
jgi:Cytochrome P450